MKRLFEVSAWPTSFKRIVVAQDKHDAISLVANGLVGDVAPFETALPLEMVDTYNTVVDIVTNGLTAKEVKQ